MIACQGQVGLCDIKETEDNMLGTHVAHGVPLGISLASFDS